MSTEQEEVFGAQLTDLENRYAVIRYDNGDKFLLVEVQKQHIAPLAYLLDDRTPPEETIPERTLRFAKALADQEQVNRESIGLLILKKNGAKGPHNASFSEPSEVQGAHMTLDTLLVAHLWSGLPIYVQEER